MKRHTIKSFKDIKHIIKNKLDVFDENEAMIPYKIFLTYTLKEVLEDLFDKGYYLSNK